MHVRNECLWLTALSPVYSDAWKSRWMNSEHKSDYGQLKLTSGNFYGDVEKDKGKVIACLHLNMHIGLRISVGMVLFA